VGEVVARFDVLGVGCDTQGECRVGERALVLEGVFLDPAPDFLGYPERLFLGEAGEDSLILVAAEAGGLVTTLDVQLPNDTADLADDELA
jgi:hypothetical protein